jgi:AcrR family transcriptional regulator
VEAASGSYAEVASVFQGAIVSGGDEKERKPRADSLRNREQLLEAAKSAFNQIGADAPLEEIARRAGLGIGTLYRHFPTRDALLAAVYRREVEQLSRSADSLLAARPAGEALEAWMHLLVDYMATKRVIAPLLQASPGEGQQAYASAGAAITQALDKLAQAAREGGAIRPEIGPEDLYRALIGVSFGYDKPGWEDSARRLIGVLIAGLRPPA